MTDTGIGTDALDMGASLMCFILSLQFAIGFQPIPIKIAAGAFNLSGRVRGVVNTGWIHVVVCVATVVGRWGRNSSCFLWFFFLQKCDLETLRRHWFNFLHVSLTAVCQTGVSSSNPRQSHRVHPVHETKKSHTPAGHRRPEEAERTAGAARYVPASLSVSFSASTVDPSRDTQLSLLPPLLFIPPNLLLNHSASVRALRFNSTGFCALKGKSGNKNTEMPKLTPFFHQQF